MNPRVVPAILSVALIAITLSPVLRQPSDDGYPLSTYPMFAFKRPTKLTMDYALGVTAAGKTVFLRPWHTGSGEVLQARAIIDRGVHGGPKALGALCTDIAKRVATDEEFPDVVTIELVTGTHDAVDYLVRHVEGKVTVKGQCKVPR